MYLLHQSLPMALDKVHTHLLTLWVYTHQHVHRKTRLSVKTFSNQIQINETEEQNGGTLSVETGEHSRWGECRLGTSLTGRIDVGPRNVWLHREQIFKGVISCFFQLFPSL